MSQAQCINVQGPSELTLVCVEGILAIFYSELFCYLSSWRPLLTTCGWTTKRRADSHGEILRERHMTHTTNCGNDN
jgi:hypothetical protein